MIRTPLAVQWLPPGPVAAAFEGSDALNPIIVGPVGSGKTTAAVRKIARIARRCPSQIDIVDGVESAVKRCRVAIVAADYRILWKNLIPSYWKVFPQEWGKWRGGVNEPAVHHMQIIGGEEDGRRLILDIRVDFIGVGDKSLDDLTRGLEITAAYIYEFDTLPQETIAKFFSRCGRYPNMGDGKAQDLVPRQVWCDCNAFDVDHWAYPECFETPPPGRETFVQPGGRAANAENVQNVGRRYYDDLVAVLKPWEVDRLVDNRFAPDRPGAVIFADFRPDWHLSATPLPVNPALPLLVGVDPGLNAAAVVMQRRGRYAWSVLAELATPPGEIATAEAFGRALADLLKQNFPRHPALAICDPAAAARSAVSGEAWMRAFIGGFDYPTRLAASNRVKGVDGRIAAVRSCLTTQSGGVPGLLIDPSCKMVRKGFSGGYRWKVEKSTGKRTDEIDKTPSSHATEAVQYPIQTIEADVGALTGAGHGRGAMPGSGIAPVDVIR
jgi:hypothetical protein